MKTILAISLMTTALIGMENPRPLAAPLDNQMMVGGSQLKETNVSDSLALQELKEKAQEQLTAGAILLNNMRTAGTQVNNGRWSGCYVQ